MLPESEIREKLCQLGADFVHFVDISGLSEEQNKGFNRAILLGIALSPEYLRQIVSTPDYIKDMIRNGQTDQDEFHLKEARADQLADFIAAYLNDQGYPSYSQSENNLYTTGNYDPKTKTSVLPHKTIGAMAGLGWIGKHSLLVTDEFACAFCMCSVLTNVPLQTIPNNEMKPKCGSCEMCRAVCPEEALTGTNWSKITPRDELVDVFSCSLCLKCLAHCPWTQAYAKKLQITDPTN